MRTGGKHKREVRRGRATTRSSASAIAMFAAGGGAVVVLLGIGALSDRHDSLDPTPPAAAATAGALTQAGAGRTGGLQAKAAGSLEGHDNGLGPVPGTDVTWFGGSTPVRYSTATNAGAHEAPAVASSRKPASERARSGKPAGRDKPIDKANSKGGRKPVEAPPASNLGPDKADTKPPAEHRPVKDPSDPAAEHRPEETHGSGRKDG